MNNPDNTDSVTIAQQFTDASTRVVLVAMRNAAEQAGQPDGSAEAAE